MSKFCALVSLLIVAFFLLACGSSNQQRQLQSVSVKAAVSGMQVQFIATGSFSAAPMTVTPLPVDWSGGYLSPPVSPVTYSLSTQPYDFECTTSGEIVQVTAMAPSNPSAATSGSLPWSEMVMGHAAATCP
jgi:hypothetical protein